MSGSGGDDSPTTLVVASASNPKGEAIAIEDGQGVLIGRKPDAGQLPEAALGARPVRVVTPSISANHLSAYAASGDLCLEDLGSRNGTWLRLPPRRVVRVAAHEPVAVWLGRLGEGERTAEEPEDASWTQESDYAAAIVRALDGWLKRRQISARLELSPGRRAAAHPGQIPLADGQELLIQPLGTIEIDWTEALGTLWRYVTRQNRLFESETSARAEGMILASKAIRAAHRTVVEAATRSMRVLLIGPSGSGKEELARCYHRAAAVSGPFVARNCAMFNKELLRSELFGAEAGAFTGATHKIIGAVERAHGGTLFLDEIGDMPLEVQPMLLRFLDRGEYERVGAYGQSRTAAVRLVCATNKDLRAASIEGQFRADLWFRLSIQVVEVPPLRERPEDVIAYLQRCELAPRLSTHAALTPEALNLVLQHPWEGNFRELANFVERLPREVRPSSIDAGVCGRALSLGALSRRVTAATTTVTTDTADSWAQLAATAVEYFVADYGRGPPRTWDDVKDYVEKYLKPLLFAHLGELGPDATRAELDIQALARRLEADRGTVNKQLARYLERFTPR